ncbi:hypothetical protein FKP32DRAFT_1535012, partial [Trametes sanguinea]
VTCKPWEGKVATQGTFLTMVITTPNMDYIPQMPIERNVVETFTDGRWGLREYSRWPQMLVPEMMHVACIPTSPSPPEVPEVLWETMTPHTHWVADPSTGVEGLGFVKEDTRTDLQQAARVATLLLRAVKNGPEKTLEYGRFLCMVLSQAVDRMMEHPTSPQLAIIVAAHVQRL